ncbi:MAG: putative b-glycosidase, glycoside hydrolase family 8 protein, partial [Verrucomicrobiota bacterium]
MNTFLRRILAPLASVLALVTAPVVWGAPPLNVTVTAPVAGNLGALASPTNSVIFTATATPSGGAAFITQVDFRVNNVSVGVAVAPGPFTVNWTPTVPGTFSLTAIATDSSAASNNSLTSPAVSVTVSAVRIASMSSPASNSSATLGSDLLVRASSSISDGAVRGVEFFLVDAGFARTSLGVSTTIPYSLSATIPLALPAGAYNLVAVATASDNVTTWESTASYPITLFARPGVGPVVAFVAPGVTDIITVGSVTTVTATASDADGFIPNTAPGGVSFYADGELIATDLSAPFSVSWTPTTARTVSLTAIATDDKGNSTAATRTVTVLAAAPTVTISSPSNNSTATVNTAVTVSASATAGVGTTIANVQFFADGVSIATDTTAPYSVSWTPLAAGTAALTARVTDSNGTIVTSSAVSVTVSVASTPTSPTITVSVPTTGAVVTVGSSQTLTAAVIAGAAAISQVQFLVGSTIVGTDTSAPYSVVWVPSTAGNFSITARVIDANNLSVTSSAVTVTATSATAVAITAPATNSTATVGSAATVTASAAPVAGSTITSVTFFATPPSGIAAQIGAPVTVAPYTLAWTPAVAGVHTLTAV